jgi:Pentapeptide repeats (8 copies)
MDKMNGTQLQQRYKAGDRDFRGIDLSNANLVWFELSGADLRDTNLNHANLSGANLSEANLSGSTNLAFADLSRTDLQNANLRGTRLEGANLEGAILEGALYDDSTKFPIGFDPSASGAISVAEIKPPVTTPSPTSDSPTPQPSSQEDLRQYTTKAEYDQNAVKRTLNSENTPPLKQPLQQALDAFQTVAQPKVEEVISQLKQSLQNIQTPSTTVHTTASPATTNTSGQGKSSIVPAEIRKWNWGGFLLPGFWFLSNQVWGGFWLWILVMIPGFNALAILCFAIAFGANGNEYAWKSRRWNSIQDFRAHQRAWAIAGFALWGFFIFVSLSSRR